jgi:hypothetical protein
VGCVSSTVPECVTVDIYVQVTQEGFDMPSCPSKECENCPVALECSRDEKNAVTKDGTFKWPLFEIAACRCTDDKKRKDLDGDGVRLGEYDKPGPQV